ncbi:MAG: CYTH domain-containing protein [Deltaproteobacteria bacterium]|nr:CYTH domain-containing protein [Deltaproteobacteria bacterium]
MNEIERKFLVDTSRWKPRDAGTLYRQGYLSSHKERVVRVRLEGERAVLTIKGATKGITRAEYEYEIPHADAVELLPMCEQPVIEKTRHVEQHGDLTWEIDVFHGVNDGLVIAEVELASEDQAVERPPWVTDDVSEDPRYYNANLIAHPFSVWAKP